MSPFGAKATVLSGVRCLSLAVNSRSRKGTSPPSIFLPICHIRPSFLCTSSSYAVVINSGPGSRSRLTSPLPTTVRAFIRDTRTYTLDRARFVLLDMSPDVFAWFCILFYFLFQYCYLGPSFLSPSSRDSDLQSHSRLTSLLPTMVRAFIFIVRRLHSATPSLVDARWYWGWKILFCRIST